MSHAIKIFGIRHHGPGCSKSLLNALDDMRPDKILIEGPPEGDALIRFINDDGMSPPVAILVHAGDDPECATFYPFAEFSPEWNAMKFAVKHGISVSFMDLPVGLDSFGENHIGRTHSGESPLDAFAKAAGYGDGETWWNLMVEERHDDSGLFHAILETMKVLRDTFPKNASEEESDLEARREAYMRKTIRKAIKDGYSKIAVVCGAWHAPALEDLSGNKKDDDILKPLQKRKMTATWIPWSYEHISQSSGYGAGVSSPGWYEHIWNTSQKDRITRWFGKIAQCFRNEEIDCSSAHIIEAVRLADALAALREKPQAGLDEIDEAAKTVICLGETAPMRLIRKTLNIGDRIGRIPKSAPTVPLQHDFELSTKRLRIRLSTQDSSIDLDLRKPNDLEKSHLLHRLNILGVKLGRKQGKGFSSKGTFHEIWSVRWHPEMALSLIFAAQYGNSIKEAATKIAINAANSSKSISEVSELMHQVLLSDMRGAVDAVSESLDSLTARSGDVAEMMRGVSPLVQTMRYGNVRKTDLTSVDKILRHMMSRISAGLPNACTGIDDASAYAMNELIVSVSLAVELLREDEINEQWLSTMEKISADSYHGAIAGLATRLSFDAARFNIDVTAEKLQKALSSGNPPNVAGEWIEGFLNKNANALIHDASLWEMIDSWLIGLNEEQFKSTLPLLRRAFSSFSANERHQLSKMTQFGISKNNLSDEFPTIDKDRANLVIPVALTIIGVPNERN